jgi:hypothetical protein
MVESSFQPIYLAEMNSSSPGRLKRLYAGRWLFAVLRVGVQHNFRSQISAGSYPVYHPIVDDQQLRERTIRQVQDAVSQMFGLSTEELRTKSRSRDVVLPRQVAMYLAKQLTQASLPEIGQEFGGKHQTSVMHSISRIHHLRTLTPEWTRLYGIF